MSVEQHKATKANFDFNHAREKLETMQGQIQALQEEKNYFQERLEDVTAGGGTAPVGFNANMSGDNEYSIDLLPPSVKLKIVALEVRSKSSSHKVSRSVAQL